jgi:hypothetical protein
MASIEAKKLLLKKKIAQYKRYLKDENVAAVADAIPLETLSNASSEADVVVKEPKSRDKVTKKIWFVKPENFAKALKAGVDEDQLRHLSGWVDLVLNKNTYKTIMTKSGAAKLDGSLRTKSFNRSYNMAALAIVLMNYGGIVGTFRKIKQIAAGFSLFVRLKHYPAKAMTDAQYDINQNGKDGFLTEAERINSSLGYSPKKFSITKVVTPPKKRVFLIGK